MRDGSGIYTYPPGTPGVAGQTIFSARYNTFLDDLATTLNTVLPINMGGTGSNTGPGAADALGAVKKTGDTMTGDLTMSKASPSLTLNANIGTQSVVWGQKGGVNRWAMLLGDNTAESGSNAGSNFSLLRYNDAGGFIDPTFTIMRSTGGVNFTGALNVSGAVTAQQSLNVTGDTTFGGYVTSNYGRIIAKSSGGTPSLTVYPFGYPAFCLHADAGSQMKFGQCDGVGTPFSLLGLFNTSGWFQISGNTALKVGGGPWSDSSDARIKDVLGEYTSGLDAVKALRPVRYTYKGNDTPANAPPENRKELDENNLVKEANTKEAITVPYGNSPHYYSAITGKEHVGLVAQEVEGIFPEMVSQREAMIDGKPVTDLRDLDTGPLVFALINAVKELTARIEALEAAASP